jgi:exopolysaccharide production protein ExoZ
MLYSIHFLRFIAATGVVVHHSGVLARWNIVVGSAGVDLFFVISGVVIALSTPPEMPIRDFLLRRFIRIYPLYWLALAAWVGYALANGGWFHVEDVVRSALLVPDLSRAWVPVYLPAWTLVFEIFFYAVFAACMLTGRFARPLCGIVLVAVAFTFARSGDPQIYFGLAMLLLEFVAGMLIAAAVVRSWVPGRTSGALLIGVALVWFAVNATPTEMPREIYWGIPAVLLVYGVLGFENLAFLRSGAALFGGNASYAIYLAHFTVIQAVFLIAGRVGFPVEAHPRIVGAIAIPAALAVGALFYLAADRPLLHRLRAMLLRHGEGLTPPRQTPATATTAAR